MLFECGNIREIPTHETKSFKANPGFYESTNDNSCYKWKDHSLCVIKASRKYSKNYVYYANICQGFLSNDNMPLNPFTNFWDRNTSYKDVILMFRALPSRHQKLLNESFVYKQSNKQRKRCEKQITKTNWNLQTRQESSQPKHHEPRYPECRLKRVQTTDPDRRFHNGVSLTIGGIVVHRKLSHAVLQAIIFKSTILYTYQKYINFNNLYADIYLSCIDNIIYVNYCISMSMFHKYIKDLRKKGKRSFTIQQLIVELKTAHAVALVGLHRLKQDGDIISPARGFYVIVPPEYQRQGSIPPEELVVLLMEHLNQPYYVSLLSAAQYYGATHQRPNSFQVVCNRRIQHPLEFGSISIDAVYKQDLKSLPLNQTSTPVGYLNIASPELLLFDLFYYSKRSGGLNHIATLLSELIASIDILRVIDLANRLNEKAWVQRLGYTLDHIETEDEDKKVMITDKLLEYLSNQMKLYVPMEPGIDRKGYPRNKKWKIIENVKIESDV